MRYLISKSCNNSVSRETHNGFLVDHSPVYSAELISSIIAHDDAGIQRIITRNINSQQLKQIFRYAIINSKIVLVKLCIAQNVSVNSTLQFHKKFVLPLDIAQINTHPEIIKLLIEQGACTKDAQKEKCSAANIVETEEKDLELTGEGAEF